jgi:hypothetical protein
MRIRSFISCFIGLVGYFNSIGQDALHTLRQGEVDRILNTAFSSLVTSSTNYGEIGTYVSLDPINTAFTLKGTVPCTPGRQKNMRRQLSIEDRLNVDSACFSYLSFSLSGNLIDKSYAQLFSNSSLNAGFSGTVQYNFTIGRPHFSFDEEEWQVVSLKRDRLLKAYRRDWQANEIAYSDSAVLSDQSLLQLQLVATRNRLTQKMIQRDQLSLAMDTLDQHDAQFAAFTDSLASIKKSIVTLQATLDKTADTFDSLQLAKKYTLYGLKEYKRKLLDEKLQKDYDSIVLKAPLAKIRLVWYTLLGGVGKKSFFTFDPTLQFSSQIASNSLVTFTAGVAVNYINVNRLNRRTFLINGSVSYLRDNNLASLTTTEVDQTKKTVNAGGDTSRTITKKYNVYTDPVQSFMATNITANAYYIFGRTPLGFHLGPSVNFQNNGLNLINLTAGCILAFRNDAKDRPVVNTELYVTFKDIGDQQHLQQGFWRRNEIGLSFTVPFNVFF